MEIGLKIIETDQTGEQLTRTMVKNANTSRMTYASTEDYVEIDTQSYAETGREMEVVDPIDVHLITRNHAWIT